MELMFDLIVYLMVDLMLHLMVDLMLHMLEQLMLHLIVHLIMYIMVHLIVNLMVHLMRVFAIDGGIDGGLYGGLDSGLDDADRFSHKGLPGQPLVDTFLPDRATKCFVICLYISVVGQPKCLVQPQFDQNSRQGNRFSKRM